MQKNSMKDINSQKVIQDQSNRQLQTGKEQKDAFQENFRLDQSKVVNKPHFENQSIQTLKKDVKLQKENTTSLGFNNQLMSMPSFGPAVGQFKSHQSQSINPPSAIIAQSQSSQMYNNFYNNQIQEQNQFKKISPSLRDQTGTGYFVQASESNQSHLSSAVQTPNNITNNLNITPHHIRYNPDNSVLDNTYPSPKLRMIAQKPDESMISNLQFDRLNTSHFQLKPYFQVQNQQKAINFNEISYLKDNKMINEDQYKNFHLQQQNLSVHNHPKRQQLPKKYQVLNLQHAQKGNKLSNAHKQESAGGSNISSDEMNIDTLSSQCDLTQSNSREKEFDKSQSLDENGPEKNQEKLQFHDQVSQINAIQYTPYQYPGYEYNLRYLNNELNLVQSKNVLNKTNNNEKDVFSSTMANKALQPFQFKKQTNQGYPLQSEQFLIPNDKSSGFDTGRTNYLQNQFNARQFQNYNQYNNASGWNTQRGRASPLDMFNDPNQMANTDRQRFIANYQTQGNQKQQNCYEQNGCLNQNMNQQQYQNDQNQFNKQALQYQQTFFKLNEVPQPFQNFRHDYSHYNHPQRNMSHNYYQMQNVDVRFSQFQQREHQFENENYNIPQTPYVPARNLDNQYPNNFRQFQNKNDKKITDKLEYQDRNKTNIQVPIYQTKSSTIQQNKNSAIEQTQQNTYYQKLYQKIQEDSERIAQYSKRNQEDKTPRLKSKSPQEILKQERNKDTINNRQKYLKEIQTPSDSRPKTKLTTNYNSQEKSVKIRGSKSVENLSVIEKNSSSLNYNEMVTQGNELCVLFDYDKQFKKNQQKSSEIGRVQQNNQIVKDVINDQEVDLKNLFNLKDEIKKENNQAKSEIKLSNGEQQPIVYQKSPDETDSKDKNQNNPPTQKIVKHIKNQNNSISSTTKGNTSTDKVQSRLNSLRIQDQLLSHVKQNGFKEGFNNQKNEDSNRVGFEIKETKRISQFSLKKNYEQVQNDKQNNSQSSDELDDQKETKTIIDQKQQKKTQNIIFNNSPKLKSSPDDKKQIKEIFEWDLKVKINNQPVEVNKLTQTPLGQLMNKIGLQLTTGDHLNKLLVQKTRSVEANLRSHSEGDSFSRSNYAALMSTSQDFSNQKINESKKEMQKASVQSRKQKSKKSSKQNTILNKADSRHSSQGSNFLKKQEQNKINETGDFMGQTSKVLVGLSEQHISDLKSQKSHSSQSITRQLNNYVIDAPVTPVQQPKFVQQQIKLQGLLQNDPDAFKTPQATSRKPSNQAKNIVPFAQTYIQPDNFVAKTPEQTKKGKPKNQISKAIELEDVSQKQSLENKSDYSGLPQIQRKQEKSRDDISAISQYQPVKSQYGWDGQTQMDPSEISKFRCPDRKAENSQSDTNSMYSNNLIQQNQFNQQRKPTQRYSQNIIRDNLVGANDWDIKTVINKPKDYDNSSQQTLQQPIKRKQENSVSDISTFSQFGKFGNPPINWDAKTAKIKTIDDWTSSPLLPPTKRLIEKTNSEISQSYVNTFKTPFVQPRRFGQKTEIEEQSSTGPMPGLESKRRMHEKSVSDISGVPINSPFLTLKRDIIKEQKSAKQPQKQYFHQVYNSKAFETEEGLEYKIDYFVNKNLASHTSQSLSSQQNFRSTSNSQSNQVTIATIQGNAEIGVTIVKVPDQVDNNTYGFNKQLKKLMRQSQDKFQNSSNKIEIKYNGSFQLNKDSLIRSQASQQKSQHSNNSEVKDDKKNKFQRADTFANLEGSIQNQSGINQEKSQQFKSNEIEDKAISEKSISQSTEQTKEDQIITKNIF